MIRGISISGKMCTGKDLLAAYYCSIIPLLTNGEYVGEQIAFADKLKTLTDHTNILIFMRDCYELGYSEADVKIMEAAIHRCHDKHPLIPGRKPREFLQDLGVQLRSINSNIWIEHLKLQLSRSINNNIMYVISDCRFKNEIEFANNHNLTRVILHTEEEIRRDRVRIFRGADQATEEIFNHISERDLDNLPSSNFDININNSSSLIHLFNNSKNQLYGKLTYQRMNKVVVEAVKSWRSGFLGC